MPPKNTKKLPCPRCKGDHPVEKCQAKDMDISKLWSDYDALGEPYEVKRGVEDCKLMVKQLQPGRNVTKRMMEALFQKAFVESIANKTVAKAKVYAPPAAPAPAPRTAPTSAPAPATRDFNRPAPTSKPSNSVPQKSSPNDSSSSSNVPPPRWHTTYKYPSGLPGAAPSQSSDQAVWLQCPVNSTCDDKTGNPARRGTGGDTIRIVTNYVAVNKVPAKIYVYSIKYVSGQEKDGSKAKTSHNAPASTDFPDMGSMRGALPTTNVATDQKAGGDHGSVSLQTTLKEGKTYGKLLTATSEKTLGLAGDTAGERQGDDEQSGEEREVKRRSEKRCVFDTLKAQDPFTGRHDWATDFDSVWSLTPLDFGSSIEPSEGQIFNIWAVTYRKPTGRQAELDRVEFTYLRSLDFTNGTATQALIKSGLTTTKGASAHVTALNGLISKHATELQVGKITQIGPNKFFLCNGFTNLSHPASQLAPFNAHRGYFSSIRPGNEKVLLNVSTKAGTFYNPMKVSTFLESISHKAYHEYGPEREKLLIGRSVRVCYDRARTKKDFDPNEDRNQHKTIASFGKVPSQQMFHNQQEGRMMSVEDYFVNKLGAIPAPSNKHKCANVGLAPRVIWIANEKTGLEQQIQDPKTIGKQVWIPAEYLELDPNQPFSKRLCSHDMESMLVAALHHPADMQKLIVNEGLRILGVGGPTALGLSVDARLLEIPGRMMRSPTIAFATGTIVPKAASWSLGGRDGDMKFFQPSPQVLSRGVYVIDFVTGGVGGESAEIGRAMTERLKDHGIRFNDTRSAMAWLFLTHSEEDLVREISEFCDIWGKAELFIVLLNDTDSANYAKVKRIFDQHLGLHTVCLTAAKFSTRSTQFKLPSPQLLSNLALKFNMKLRGQNHQVSIGQGRHVTSAFANISSDTIVLGADVSHAPSQMAHCPSVASVVGNDDKALANFPGSMRLQASRQEIIEELEDMVTERIIAYTKGTKSFPARMILYRDGVGEDQFQMVRDVEIPRVHNGFQKARSVCQQIRGLTDHINPLKLTFIVVGKRHNTRFFCKDIQQTTKFVGNAGELGGPGSRSVVETNRRTGQQIIKWDPHFNGNVAPGLIVDSVITRPPDDKKIFDFFLQAHQALQGTAKAGHYTVLEQGPLSVNEIQNLTHAFCYNYGRATKGVSYAGPAYYADRLCERGTHYLKAYTEGRKEPQWPMTKEEKQGGKEGTKAYQKRVAGNISETKEWNPHVAGLQGRKNPWHPKFDDRMFWL